MGKVISFEERAVATLRDRLGAAESAKEDLIAFAQGHSGATAAIHSAVLALMATSCMSLEPAYVQPAPAVPASWPVGDAYLAQSEATIETPLGDARLTLEREAPAALDLLAIDAFSSDAIPVHLITSEALSVYERNIEPDGVIAFHVTNRFLDLVPVVRALADAHGMEAVWIKDDTSDSLASRSDWVLVSRNRALLARPRIAEAAREIDPRPDVGVWTDDFNNLFQVLRW